MSVRSSRICYLCPEHSKHISVRPEKIKTVDRKKERKQKKIISWLFTRYRIPVVSCKYLSHETFHDKSEGPKHTIHEGASRFPFTPLWEDGESQVRRRRLRPTAVSHSAFTSVSLAEERPQLAEAARGRGSWKSKNSQPRAQRAA